MAVLQSKALVGCWSGSNHHLPMPRPQLVHYPTLQVSLLRGSTAQFFVVRKIGPRLLVQMDIFGLTPPHCGIIVSNIILLLLRLINWSAT